jgi:hypothetical protein
MIVYDIWYNNALIASVCGMLIIKWFQGELLLLCPSPRGVPVVTKAIVNATSSERAIADDDEIQLEVGQDNEIL